MANNFEYYSPTKVYFGKGEEKNVGRYIREYGANNVMIVYGGSSAKKSGLLDLVKDALSKENLSVTEIGGVVPNPHLDKVYEGIELGKKIKQILSWQLVVEVPLIQRRLSHMVLQNQIKMYGSFMSTHVWQRNVFLLQVF